MVTVELDLFDNSKSATIGKGDDLTWTVVSQDGSETMVDGDGGVSTYEPQTQVDDSNQTMTKEAAENAGYTISDDGLTATTTDGSVVKIVGGRRRRRSRRKGGSKKQKKRKGGSNKKKKMGW